MRKDKAPKNQGKRPVKKEAEAELKKPKLYNEKKKKK